MSYEHRSVWVMLVLAVTGYGVYVGLVLSRVGSQPLPNVDYVPAMLWTICGAIVASIIAHMFLMHPDKREKRDRRDLEIDRFGEFIGHGVLVAGALAALLLAMVQAEHFWIANVIYLAFAVSAIVASIAKLVAYRSGMPW
ncbi:hypothetical protein OH146_03320 [Salinibacterium sp. SYSU T00001]|uniref:hypothetical protein n=1 Tax=Homoserinimonas sedimenticola TaxID=2986805 RepID=UPI002236ADDE|nr:hypothetical protein [Salinibacterium sedimenticola]MCW4384800.1 hypothetical protein [Salinibacterium sedimenticola]